jgi:hypothetical protein|tara:strand:+ start:8292 stop:8825 length:534 start_codon:yes stop_codon:yes gene_type:complete
MSKKLSPNNIIKNISKNDFKPFNNKILIYSIASSLFALIINLLALSWLDKLNKINCPCSQNWMHKYIKYYLLITIPISLIGIVINIYAYFNNYTIVDLYSNDLYVFFRRLILPFIFIFGLANIVIVILFINKLKKMNCECSEDIKREIYWIYNIVVASVIAIFILFSIIGFITFLFK